MHTARHRQYEREVMRASSVRLHAPQMTVTPATPREVNMFPSKGEFVTAELWMTRLPGLPVDNKPHENAY
jgi:hypothetical protein